MGCTSGCEELEVRLKKDHAVLRQMLRDLDSAAPEAATELLHQFGSKLEGHIRFEEREYFPRLQELLTDEELARLAEALAQ